MTERSKRSSNWVKIQQENVNRKENSESHSSNEKKRTNSNKQLNCYWKFIKITR